MFAEMFWKKEGEVYVKVLRVGVEDNYLPVLDPNDSKEIYERVLDTIEQMDIGEGEVPAWKEENGGKFTRVMVDAGVFLENDKGQESYLWYLDPNEDLETYVYVVESMLCV
jgi:hypothetical protein